MAKILDVLDLMRIDKLSRHTGYMLIFLPCAIGTGLYGNFVNNYKALILFFIGSFVMRSAGCIINDILDRNIDKHVVRTKTRPLADGRITVLQGLVIFCVLSLIGLGILVQFSQEAIVVGLISMLLLLTYPLAKHITFWPQLYLGFAFNIGILVAVMEAKGYITTASVLLYVGGIFWTLYYDTLYAFADLECDKKIGVKSLARFLEKKNYKLWLGIFAILANIIVTHALISTKHNLILAISSFVLVLCIISWQIFTLDIHKVQNCLDRFKYNNYIGIIWAVASLY